MATVNPLLYPSQWTFMLIAGKRTPGVLLPFKPKRKHSWDKKRGKGAQGATVTYQGFEPAAFEVTFQLWRYPGVTGANDPDDLGDWDKFVSQLCIYDPTKDPTMQAYDVYYPGLVAIGVKSVVIEDATGAEHQGGNLYHGSISFLEYGSVPAKNATATPSGAAAGVNGVLEDPRNVTTRTPSAQELLQQLQKQAASPTG